jgi:hypothetical protein
MTVGIAPPAVLAELSRGTIPDELESRTDVETLGDMGRWAASSALRNSLWDTTGVAWGVCESSRDWGEIQYHPNNEFVQF